MHVLGYSFCWIVMQEVLSCLTLLQYNELVDKVTSSETKVTEMETTVEDLQWDIEKLRNREQKLNKHLAEAMEQVCLSNVPLQLLYPLLHTLQQLSEHENWMSYEVCRAELCGLVHKRRPTQRALTNNTVMIFRVFSYMFMRW